MYPDGAKIDDRALTRYDAVDNLHGTMTDGGVFMKAKLQRQFTNTLRSRKCKRFKIAIRETIIRFTQVVRDQDKG